MNWKIKMILGFGVASGLYWLIKKIQQGYGLDIFAIGFIILSVLLFGSLYFYVAGSETNG